MKKIIWILFPFILLLGCSDDEADAPATVTFENSSSQVQEDDNYKVINVVMSHAMGTDVEVAFETSGQAAQNGHYALVTPSPIIIEAGSTSGEIVFESIDNSVLEVENATFTVELTSASGATLGEAGSLTHDVEIIDNNEVPANDLQVDLLWNLEGEQDIDQADLDLLLISDVVEEDGSVVDFNVMDVSDSESGFETVLLRESDPDNEYYIAVLYIEGSHPVNYRVHVSNAAWGTDAIEDTFAANEVGGGRIYGPIPKEGSNYFGGRKTGARLSSSAAAVSPLLLKK